MCGDDDGINEFLYRIIIETKYCIMFIQISTYAREWHGVVQISFRTNCELSFRSYGANDLSPSDTCDVLIRNTVLSVCRYEL